MLLTVVVKGLTSSKMAGWSIAYFYTIFLLDIFIIGSAVEIKDKLPHSTFGDLNDDLHASDSAHKTFTIEELSKYDGQNPDLPIFVAVKGVVFDVSEGKDVYGPGKPYHPLTGKDASRAIAKWSLESSNLNGNIDDLSQEEFNRLEDTFQKVYMQKYPVVGYLKGHEPKADDINRTWMKEDL